MGSDRAVFRNMFGILRVYSTGRGNRLEESHATNLYSLALIVVAEARSPSLRRHNSNRPAPSEQTREQMHIDVDKGLKTSEPNEQMQRDADKGIKTRNSGEFGYVADQDKPGASAILRAGRKATRRRVRPARQAPRKTSPASDPFGDSRPLPVLNCR